MDNNMYKFEVWRYDVLSSNAFEKVKYEFKTAGKIMLKEVPRKPETTQIPTPHLLVWLPPSFTHTAVEN